jgi:hypothetical protein
MFGSYAATDHDAHRIPTLSDLTLTFVPFALVFLGVLIAGMSGPSVAVARAQFLIWLSLVLATPALCIYFFRVGRMPLSNLWRLYWTVSFLAYAAHFYFGFFFVFGGDISLVALQQSPLVAFSNFLVTGLWACDVVLAWATTKHIGWVGILRGVTHILVFVSFFVVAVLSRTGTVQLLGIGLTICLFTVACARFLQGSSTR